MSKSKFAVSSYKDVSLETPLEEISTRVEQVTEGFHSHKTLPLEFRKSQLRNLYYALYDNLDLIYDAFYKDLHKSQLEVDLSELSFVFKEIIYFIDNLEKLAKPIKAPVEMMFKPASASVYKQPFGVVLVISPWNYPLSLSISPIAAAIAAGNTVILKTSELCPNVSQVLIKVLEHALDPSIFRGVAGAIPASTELLKLKFDKIMYTGNGVVGRIVSRAAAEHLTPVVLELGGKSPVIITRNADLRIAARRVLWGKQVNSGQTCVAPDYILIEDSVKAKFISELKNAYKEFFPEPEPFENYSRVINERHFGRLKSVLDKTDGDIVVGGKVDASDKFISPTFVDNVKRTDSLMEEEIFGPLIGLITVKNVDEAIEFIKREHDTPLALYIFSKDHAEQQKIISLTRSGAVGINDPLMHVVLLNVPFGGVGESGTGGYHGQYGFDSFSHLRTVFHQSSLIERLLAVRYPPYITWKKNANHNMTIKKPWFGREGIVKKSIFKSIWNLKTIAALIAVLAAYVKYAKK